MHGFSGFIRNRLSSIVRYMNPILVIAAFVVLLGILLYFMQKKETAPEILPRAEKESITEKRVVKANDYQAQYEREKKEQPTPETKITDEETSVDDIAKLEGVGPKYQELLRTAGYTSIKTIADSNPETLYKKLIETNEETGITKRPPTLKNIEEWITAANSRQA